jgi:homocysteine S-methyltransferase
MMQAVSTTRETAFTRLLAGNRPVLLDGGLATQLESQGHDIGNSLWSASLLQHDTEAIVTAHCAFIEAGAECIETASYQASREGFGAVGIGVSEADELMRLSVALAKRARDTLRSDVAIAASLGPYGAMLHDGSEYHGNYDVDKSVLHRFHESRLALFDETSADVLALETIPSFAEAEVLGQLLRDCTTPAWISFSCRDAGHLCDGTPIGEVAELFQNHPVVKAVGINCTSPQFVPGLIRVLRSSVPDKHVLAYPNSGETYQVSDNSWTGTVSPVDCAAAATEWIRAGAKAVGGCCRMGPAHIAAMREQLMPLR